MKSFTEPWYFLLAYVKYLLVGLLALFLARGRGQRLRLLPVVPVYFFYALAQIVPTTINTAPVTRKMMPGLVVHSSRM